MHISKLFHVQFWGKYVNICLLNSLESPLWQGALLYIHFTLLWCPPEQMPTKLHIHVPLHCYSSVHTDPKQYTQNTQEKTYLSHYCHIYASNKYAPQMQNGWSMLIYVPLIRSLASTMWPGVLCTYTQYQMMMPDNDNTSQLHKLSCPLGPVRQKSWEFRSIHFYMFLSIKTRRTQLPTIHTYRMTVIFALNSTFLEILDFCNPKNLECLEIYNDWNSVIFGIQQFCHFCYGITLVV